MNRMGKDTIYRQDAIDAFKKELTVGESKGNYVTICSAVGYEGAKQILERLPSAQPKRKKGRWYDIGSLSCRCSECGCKSQKESLFCPNCGAEMKVEDTNGE